MANLIAVFGVCALLFTVGDCQNVSVWIDDSPGVLVYKVLTVGSNLTLKCKTRSSGAEVSWMHYPSLERVTAKKSQERIFSKIAAEGIVSLNIDGVTKGDGGVFKCLAQNNGTSASALLNITVYDANFCGFENGLCNFYDALGASSILNISAVKEKDLVPLQEGTGQIRQTESNRLTGPSYDVTLGPQYHNGKYMYLSSGSLYRHRYAMLISFLFNSTQTERCFSFWYHAWGPDVGKVAVSRLANGADLNLRTVLKVVTGPQGNAWKLLTVPVPPINSAYRLIIELEKEEGGNFGDIALDDVRWFDSPCNATEIPDLWHKLRTPIRLVNGTKTKEGRVEVFHEGQWGTVFSATNGLAAGVICDALGLGAKKATLKRNAFFGEGRDVRVWVGGLNCSGTERDPMACRVGKFEVTKHYDHSGDIGVVCIDECDDQPCGLSGECSNTAFGYDCSCNFGYSGKRCEEKSRSEVRLMEAGRNDTGRRVEVKYQDVWQTICPVGWTSREAHVVCSMLGYNESKATGFVDKVSDDPEFNTTEWTLHCSGNETDIVSCTVTPIGPGYECRGKYAGVICNDFCASGPCLSGGTCQNSEKGFNCTCPLGVFGLTCNEDGVDDCSSHECKNGSTCIDGVKEYTCHCPVGKTGKLCEQTVDFCDPDPCKNNRTCTSLHDGFKCDCGVSWQGEDCAQDVDECVHIRNPCPANVTCFNLEGSFSCGCPLGGEGKDCSDTKELPIEKHCPPLPDIPHGTVKRYPNLLKYVCDDGYLIDSMPNKECNQGSWVPNGVSPQCLPDGESDETKFSPKILSRLRFWKGQYIYRGGSFDFNYQISSVEEQFYANVTGTFQDKLMPKIIVTGSFYPPNRIKLKLLKKSGEPRFDQPAWVLEGNFTFVNGEWRCFGQMGSAGFGHFYMVPATSDTVIPLPEDKFNPPDKKSSKKTVSIVLPILFLVLAIAICGFVYYLYRNGPYRNKYQGATRFENPLYEQ